MELDAAVSDIWFTADSHYGHSKVIEYTKRPFANSEEMDAHLIRNWNAVVKPGDLVYHLGDFALCKESRAVTIAKRLLGQKFLIFGNHDKRLRKHKPFLDEWIWTKDIAEIDAAGQRITLCHFAMRVWNKSHHGAWHLYGHSHGSLPDDPNARSVDVGVDNWDYTPVSYDTLVKRMAMKTWKPVDHHGKQDEGTFHGEF